MKPVENLQKIRLQKLEAIKKLGKEPYPAKFTRTATIKEARDLDTQKVSIAGRIIRLRPHGKLTFTDLSDGKAEIQIAFKKDDLGKNYQLLEYLDIADFIGVTGNVSKTQAGEITVFAKDYMLLAKSLRPIPDNWHGLKDVETRYRKRYLDFLTNQDTKNKITLRSQIISAIRRFLEQKEFIEIETPTLQTIYGGAAARPFKTHYHALDSDFYLKISDELYLKRLIIGGFERVYEIDKDFRNEGIDRFHNPEFTMLECYQAYADYQDMMKLAQNIYKYVSETVLGTAIVKYGKHTFDFSKNWQQMTMKQAIKKHLDIEVDKMTDKMLKEKIKHLNLKYEEKPSLTGVAKGFNRGVAIATIFKACEDKLIQPIFITDFPKETTVLAKIHRNDPTLVERFEPYIAGFEIGNAYSELNDPILQQEFFEFQKQAMKSGDKEAHPMDKDWIEALEYGMPPTGGLGLGIDRMVMILTNTNSMREIIPFPTLKPKNG